MTPWRVLVFGLFLGALGPFGCGSTVEGPDEVTTTVTEGDEEAWSAPDDPRRGNDADEEQEDADEQDADD